MGPHRRKPGRAGTIAQARACLGCPTLDLRGPKAPPARGEARAARATKISRPRILATPLKCACQSPSVEGSLRDERSTMADQDPSYSQTAPDQNADAPATDTSAAANAKTTPGLEQQLRQAEQKVQEHLD